MVEAPSEVDSATETILRSINELQGGGGAVCKTIGSTTATQCSRVSEARVLFHLLATSWILCKIKTEFTVNVSKLLVSSCLNRLCVH